MKNIFKYKYVFIIVLILGIGTVFAYSYNASDVGYTPTDSSWSVTNVQSATDSLYLSITRKNPIGEIIAYMGNTPPEYFLECDGTVYNISDYPYLAEQIKNEFGSYNKFGGNGTTTFAVPDLRGEFLRGRGINGHNNQGSGLDAGSHQDSSEISISTYSDRIYHYAKASSNRKGTYIGNGDSRFYVQGWITASNTMNDGFNNASNDLAPIETIRPTNTSVLYAIRYE